MAQPLSPSINEYSPYSPSPDDRAYFYQLVNALESIMPQPSSVAVVVEKAEGASVAKVQGGSEKAPSVTFMVTYFIINPSFKLESSGEDSDVLEAARRAAAQLEAKLLTLFSVSPLNQARELKIEKLLGRLSVQ